MPAIDKAEYADAIGRLDNPMLIVTAAAGDERGGCLVGFSSPASLDPARFLVFISKRNRTYEVANAAQRLALHPVPEDAGDLAELFGGETGDEIDKFERCDWDPGPGGVPLLRRCRLRFHGPVVGRIDGGDHCGFLVEPDHLEDDLGFRPFRSGRGERIDPGHEP